MRQILLLLIAISMAITPVCADTYLIFADVNQRPYKSITQTTAPTPGVDTNSVNDTVFNLTASGWTDLTLTQYWFRPGRVLYLGPAPPDVHGFMLALRTEPTFTASVRIGLAGLLGLLQADYRNPAALKQDWSDAVIAYGGTWLTTSVQSTILNYAKTYNIPLI